MCVCDRIRAGRRVLAHFLFYIYIYIHEVLDLSFNLLPCTATRDLFFFFGIFLRFSEKCELELQSFKLAGVAQEPLCRQVVAKASLCARACVSVCVFCFVVCASATEAKGL